MVSIAQARRRKGAGFHWDVPALVCSAVLAIMAFLVLYPLFSIFLTSFQISRLGETPVYSFSAWTSALQSSTIVQSISNTISLTVVRMLLSFPPALLFAWLIARTDLPGRNWLEFLFWLSFFLPTLPATQGLILMLDPDYGVINRLLRHIPFLEGATFDIYSFSGIVFAHLATGTIGIKVMLMAPAFRNMDTRMEEASQASGASPLGAVLRITLPLMIPAILVVLLMSTIRALESFEIEAVLGAPKNIYVYTTQIYHMVHKEPPEFGPASALGVFILLAMIPLIVAQRLAIRKQYTTVGGQYRGNVLHLYRWRWPAFALVATVAVFTSIVPALFLVTGTFMQLFGFFDLPHPWTTRHWQAVLGDRIFFSSLVNTMIVASGTALLSVLWFSLVAYIVVRTRFAARSALDFLSWLPFALPGIILGLGFLALFLEVPLLRPLYGTTTLLILVLTLAGMTTGIQIIKVNLVQLGSELEEVARVTGSSWLHSFRTVILPLIAPALVVVGLFGFVSGARNVAHVALLAGASNRPLALLQFDYMFEGRHEAAAVIGTVIVLLTTVVALLVHTLQFRIARHHAG